MPASTITGQAHTLHWGHVPASGGVVALCETCDRWVTLIDNQCPNAQRRQATEHEHVWRLVDMTFGRVLSRWRCSKCAAIQEVLR